jgi:peptide deformylase
LSVPGIFEKVSRAEHITVRALDAKGQQFELAADGLLAVCIQHEMDHLAGKVFVDHLSALKRNMLLKRLEKQRRQAATA